MSSTPITLNGSASSSSQSDKRDSTAALSLPICIGWALGAMGANTVYMPYLSLFMRFITDYCGVAAAVGGALIGAGKLTDMISDLLIGSASDRTRSRWGRRRPYLLVGSILVVTFFIPLFSPPAALEGISLTIFLFLCVFAYSVAFALWYIPYVAMTTEMTTSYHGRSVLVSYRVTGGNIGQLIGGAGAAWLIAWYGNDRAAHGAMAQTLAVIGLIAMFLCLFLTRNAPTTEIHSRTSHDFRQKIRLALENGPFCRLVSMKIVYFIGQAFSQASIAYFTKYALGMSDHALATFLFISTIASIFSLPLWLKLAKRREKKEIIVGALLVLAVFQLSWLLVGEGEPMWLAACRFVVIGACMSGVNLMSFSMLPDTMDHDYLRTGLRREGMFAGVVVLMEKLAAAIGIGLMGLLLGAVGYAQSRTGGVGQQSADAIRGIYLAYSVIPAIGSLCAAAIIVRYGLTRRKLEAMRMAGPEAAATGQ